MKKSTQKANIPAQVAAISTAFGVSVAAKSTTKKRRPLATTWYV